MFTAAAFCRELERLGADFYAGVPDTVIQDFCNYVVENPPAGGQVIAANEGGAVGLAAGHWLATGRIPVVYMQNSGIGNAVNPLLSLADADVFAIPMLLLVGWRGEPGVKDEPQHGKQGRVSQALFASMEIPCGIIGPDFTAAKRELEQAFATMRSRPGPYALLIRNGSFEPVPAVAAGRHGDGLTREEAIRIAIDCCDDRTAFVASTGMGPRELYELRTALGQSHERDFLNAGAMGHASMIAAAAAMARPDRTVVCLDGDGALFMHLGALALIPTLPCRNLVHVLLNNGVHDSVGGQPNLGVRLEAARLADAAGYAHVVRTDCADGLRQALAECCTAAGPHFIEVEVVRGFRKNLGRPGIPFPEAARQFQSFLTTP